MKVRLKVTFTAERARKPEPAQHDEADPQPPRVDGKGSFILERAEPAPIGFTVDMPDRRHE